MPVGLTLRPAPGTGMEIIIQIITGEPDCAPSAPGRPARRTDGLSYSASTTPESRASAREPTAGTARPRRGGGTAAARRTAGSAGWHGPRRRCRRRRLGRGHRAGRPGGPRGGARRPDRTAQPPRGGYHPARGTSPRRLDGEELPVIRPPPRRRPIVTFAYQRASLLPQNGRDHGHLLSKDDDHGHRVSKAAGTYTPSGEKSGAGAGRRGAGPGGLTG